MFKVTFEFIEFGHKCNTSWVGRAADAADAIKIATKWFGFNKNGIQVTNVNAVEIH